MTEDPKVFKPYRVFNPVSPEYSGITYQDLVKPTVSSDEVSTIMETVSSTLTTVTTTFTFGAGAWFQDGTAAAPSISFANDNDSGWYRIGANNIGTALNGALVYDWNTTRLSLASGISLDITDMTTGSVLFAGSGGRVSQNNSSLFWSSSNARLGIGCNDPWTRVEIRHSSTSQLALSTNADNGYFFTAGGAGLNIQMYNNLGLPANVNLLGDDDGENTALRVRNSSSVAGSMASIQVHVEAGTGDPVFLWDVSFATAYTAGIDNSDSDKWKLSKGETLGTTDLIAITSGGYTTFTPLAASSGTSHGFTVTGPINTAGANGLFRLTNGASTGQTLSTEINFVKFDLSSTVTWAAGALANERAFQILAPTLAFAGASTVTNAATVYIDRAPQAGTNATITNAYALWVDDGISRFDGAVTFASSITASSFLNVGTATDAAATGDFASGLTGAARIFYDQSIPAEYHYNSAGTIVNQISSVAATATVWNEQGADIDFRIEGDTAANLFFVDASTDFIGINTSGPDRRFDILDGTGNPQLRLTYTDGSVYTDLKTDSVGNLYVSVTGGRVYTNCTIETLGVAIPIQSIDQTTGPVAARFKNTGGDFYFGIEQNGGGFFTGANSYDAVFYTASPFNVILDGTSRFYVNDTEVVVNEPGNDIDFRVEGDTATHMIFVDASQGVVGINTSGPDRRLDVLDASNPQIRLTSTDGSVYVDLHGNSSGNFVITPTGGTFGVAGTQEPIFALTSNAGSGRNWTFTSGGGVAITTGNLAIRDLTAGTAPLIIEGAAPNFSLYVNTSGNVGVNTSGADRKLDVLDASNPQIRLTHTDGSLYTDFQTDANGWAYILPSGGLTFIRNDASSSTSVGGNVVLSIRSNGAGRDASLQFSDNVANTSYMSMLASDFYIVPGGSVAARFTAAQSTVLNSAAIATNATDGFLYVAACAGTPTGTPTSYAGRIPIVVDSTNHKLYFYSGGAWRDAGP